MLTAIGFPRSIPNNEVLMTIHRARTLDFEAQVPCAAAAPLLTAAGGRGALDLHGASADLHGVRAGAALGAECVGML